MKCSQLFLTYMRMWNIRSHTQRIYDKTFHTHPKLSEFYTYAYVLSKLHFSQFVFEDILPGKRPLLKVRNNITIMRQEVEILQKTFPRMVKKFWEIARPGTRQWCSCTTRKALKKECVLAKNRLSYSRDRASKRSERSASRKRPRWLCPREGEDAERWWTALWMSWGFHD